MQFPAARFKSCLYDRAPSLGEFHLLPGGRGQRVVDTCLLSRTSTRWYSSKVRMHLITGGWCGTGGRNSSGSATFGIR